MSAHEALYDHIARLYQERGNGVVHLEELIEQAARDGFEIVWSVSRQAIINALLVRDIDATGPTVEPVKDIVENYDPVATDFAEFTAAAAQIMKTAEYPIDALDLISMTGLATTAVPMSALALYLRRVGIYFIPGVGYWRSAQYVDPSGRIIAPKIRGARMRELFSYFETHGWPVAGPDIERDTAGLVTSRFMARQGAASDSPIIGIGCGLYILADKATPDGLSMSRNVALSLLALTDDVIIDDKDHLRLYRLALIMERKGLATVKKSRTTRGGVRRQTARLSINPEGRALLESYARLAKDEF